VTEVWVQFGKPEKKERPTLEAVTSGLVKTKLTDKTKCARQ
jgi:hypothetical protein